MQFTEIFASTDRQEFYLACSILEEHQIPFQVQNEDRLHGASTIEYFGKAVTIAVPSYLLDKAKNLLHINWPNEQEELGLKDISHFDRTYLRDIIAPLLQSQIEEVFYLILHDIDFDFGAIHSVDYGIIIKFSEGKYLVWKFEENDLDIENNIYIPYHFTLKPLHDIDSILKEFPNMKIEAVTNNDYWKNIIGNPIEQFHVFTQTFGLHKIITDFIIKTKKHQVAILSTEQPIEDKEQIEINLSIGNEWTSIVFDQEIINALDRYS